MQDYNGSFPKCLSWVACSSRGWFTLREDDIKSTRVQFHQPSIIQNCNHSHIERCLIWKGAEMVGFGMQNDVFKSYTQRGGILKFQENNNFVAIIFMNL